MADGQFIAEVTGLSCASCAARAERALQELGPVTKAEVNFANRQAVIDLGGDGDARDVDAALTGAGYPAVRRSVSLQVDGMTCASCSARVERGLQVFPGVLSASVNFA